jgi:hypothetical protein
MTATAYRAVADRIDTWRTSILIPAMRRPMQRDIFTQMDKLELRLCRIAENLDAEAERLEPWPVWTLAQNMRDAPKQVGPYQDGASHKIWSRALYHAGKEMCDVLRPAMNEIKNRTP